jgi:hypothetical protein
MKRSCLPSLFSTLLIAATYAAGGCNKPATAPPAAGTTESSHDGHTHADGETHEEGDEHGHATAGPHGGSLIELGAEEYHAELVHNEAAATVSIYLLDGAAKNAVAIDAAELMVNVKHDGKGEQFKLAASPDSSDPAGKSSRFVSSDGELIGDLDQEHSDAELVAEINGKQFRGAIEHHHGHEEDDHAAHE